jgi:spectinomycin phosphotransferase
MRDLPEAIEESAIADALAEGWGFEAASLEYAAVGAGSFHWLARAGDGTRGFVTVDDLDAKLWLGDTRASVLEGLERAFDTARALRDHGLAFVAAPIATSRGGTLLRLGARHAIALFPFLDGEASSYGEHDAAGRAAVLELLVRLHEAGPAVASTASTAGLHISGRHHLEAALRELDRPWAGGPFSEPAREALARNASVVVELLALADRFAADVASRGGEWVVTHGEPHAGNVMRTADGCVLVDWDTVALAPPERDLWMVAADGVDTYTRATGHELDEVAVDFFTLTWDLKDLAEYLHPLRSPHRRSKDTAFALEVVRNFASIRERWASFLDRGVGRLDT